MSEEKRGGSVGAVLYVGGAAELKTNHTQKRWGGPEELVAYLIEFTYPIVTCQANDICVH